MYVSYQNDDASTGGETETTGKVVLTEHDYIEADEGQFYGPVSDYHVTYVVDVPGGTDRVGSTWLLEEDLGSDIETALEGLDTEAEEAGVTVIGTAEQLDDIGTEEIGDAQAVVPGAGEMSVEDVEADAEIHMDRDSLVSGSNAAISSDVRDDTRYTSTIKADANFEGQAIMQAEDGTVEIAAFALRDTHEHRAPGEERDPRSTGPRR